MNIDDMPAGREMDALVAEKVMGWKWDERDGCFYNDKGESRIIYFHKFSEDIIAAWEVVEHLGGLHPHVMYENCEWECCLDDHNKGHGEQFWGYAEDAPLAICRAALKSVGEKE